MTLSELQQNLMLTQFTIKGQMTSLYELNEIGMKGEKILPLSVITFLGNQSAREMCVGMKMIPQLRKNHLVEDTDVFAFPDDNFSILDIVVYPDSYEAGVLEETAYGLGQAQKIELVSAYSRIANSDLTGKPTEAIIRTQDNVKLFVFNCVCDAPYFIDVHYYKTPTTLSGASDTTGISNVFDSIWYEKTAAKMAQRLGDKNSKDSFNFDWKEHWKELHKLLTEDTIPLSVKYKRLGDA